MSNFRSDNDVIRRRYFIINILLAVLYVLIPTVALAYGLTVRELHAYYLSVIIFEFILSICFSIFCYMLYSFLKENYPSVYASSIVRWRRYTIVLIVGLVFRAAYSAFNYTGLIGFMKTSSLKAVITVIFLCLFDILPVGILNCLIGLFQPKQKTREDSEVEDPSKESMKTLLENKRREKEFQTRIANKGEPITFANPE